MHIRCVQAYSRRLILKLSIVEFASQEDAQRAIRELSEVPLLGRPVFIREVSMNPYHSVPSFLIGKC